MFQKLATRRKLPLSIAPASGKVSGGDGLHREGRVGFSIYCGCDDRLVC